VDVEEALRHAADVLKHDRVIPLAEQQVCGDDGGVGRWGAGQSASSSPSAILGIRVRVYPLWLR
jgi:hypothetical protein